MGWLVLLIWGAATFLIGHPWHSLLSQVKTRTVVLDANETVFVSTLLGNLIIGWLALSLLQLGIYSLLYLGIALVTALFLGILGLRFTHTRLLPLHAPTLHDSLVFGLLLIAVLLFFWPAEYVTGGADASVYLHLGAIWSRTGSFTFTEPLLADVSPALLPGLLRELPPGQPMQYLRFPGFYINAADPARIVPQFYPLHPMWLTLAYDMFGLSGSLYVTPLWAMLGVWAVYLAFKRLCGAKAGLIGAFLLMVTPLQIYFARYPTAEPLTQYLTWAALFSFIVYSTEGGALWGFLSGCALGQTFLTRIDALPMLLIPSVWILLYIVRHGLRIELLWFFTPFTLLLLQAVAQGLGPSYQYVWEIYGSLWRSVTLYQPYLWLLLLMLCGIPLVLYGVRRFPTVGSRLVRAVKWVGALGILGTGIYAYFVLPRTGILQEAPYWYGDGTIPVQNHLNLVRMGWYLSPLGVWLGIIGISAMVAREDWQHAWSVLGVGLSFSFIYLRNIFNNPFHIYAMRRYVPVVLPFFVLGIVYVLIRLWEWRERERQPVRIATVILGVTLVGWLGYNNRAIWNLVEFRGMTAQLEALAKRLEPDAVLLFDDAAITGTGVTIGAPLQYLYEFTAFDLQEAKLDQRALVDAIADWQEAKRPVYWVEGNDPVIGILPDAQFVPDFGVWIRAPYLEQSYFHFPTEYLEYSVPLEFYKLAGSADCVFPVQLDIGTLDSAYIQSGFYGKEWWGEHSLRWTDGMGTLTLPCLPNDIPETAQLTLTAAGMRNAGALPVTVFLSIDGVSLGGWPLGADIADLNVLVPGELLRGDGHVLEIRSDTWIPQANNVGADSRRLGVLVDQITLSPETSDD